MKITNTRKGEYFERIARDFFKKRNFKIVERNYHYHHKEIDIICVKNQIIHFVEVKGRTSNSYGEITETVTKRKADNLINAAIAWLKINKKEGCDWQIDFLGIEKTNYKDTKITFLENAINQL